ncbi:MAG: GGDEF domain-containing protein [Firmicutes bacterium]|nr:GGDEF domain-containing protein [Bacillota bacterium]
MFKKMLAFTGLKLPDIDPSRFTYQTFEEKRQAKLTVLLRNIRLLYTAFTFIVLAATYPYLRYSIPGFLLLLIISALYGFFRYFKKFISYSGPKRFLFTDYIDYILIGGLIYLTGGLKSIFHAAFIIPVMAALIRYKIKGGIIGFTASAAFMGVNACLGSIPPAAPLPVLYHLIFLFGTNGFVLWTILGLIWNEEDLSKDLYHYSLIDPLTGLYHVGYARERIKEEIQRCLRYGSLFSIIFIDMDRFKEINDRFGHLIGDVVIRHIAAVLQSELRGGDMLSRHGGDEFLILLPGTGLEEAELTLQRLRKGVREQPCFIDGTVIYLSLSGGAAEYPSEGQSTEQLLQVADQKMYMMKGRASGALRFTINS